MKKIKDSARDLLLYVRVNRPRNKWMQNNTKRKIANTPNLPLLTGAEVNELVSRWGKYGKSEEYRLYKKHIQDGCPLSSYVPWRYYLDNVDPYFCKSIEARALDNKNYYDLYFHGFNQPKTIARYMNGEYLDKDYYIITEDHYVQLCQEAEKVIIKPAMMSNGGHGIIIWTKGMPKEKLVESVRGKESVIVQEFIKQHSELQRIHKDSINTLRIITLFFNSEVHILTAYLRMGRDGAFVDNSCSGGLFCGIKENGYLKAVGFDDVGLEYTCHPQGIVFSEFLVPNYGKCVELVKRAAPRFANVAKIVPWDIAIGEDGEPIIIETNFGWPDIVDDQIASGPLFGKETLLKEIMTKINPK